MRWNKKVVSRLSPDSAEILWPSSVKNDEVASSTVPSDSTTTGWNRWVPCRVAYYYHYYCADGDSRINELSSTPWDTTVLHSVNVWVTVFVQFINGSVDPVRTRVMFGPMDRDICRQMIRDAGAHGTDWPATDDTGIIMSRGDTEKKTAEFWRISAVINRPLGGAAVVKSVRKPTAHTPPSWDSPVAVLSCRPAAINLILW